MLCQSVRALSCPANDPQVAPLYLEVQRQALAYAEAAARALEAEAAALEAEAARMRPPREL